MGYRPAIGIIGCGYVGLTLAAVLAAAGYRVHAIESDPARLRALKSGKSFFYEAGADALIRHGLNSNTLLPGSRFDALSACNIVFSCVGTPDNPDGSSNLSYVFAAAQEAARSMQPEAIFVQKSTVPVGTGARIAKLFQASKQITYVSCPEFSREGTAIRDTLWFDRIIAGSDTPQAAKQVLAIHKTIEQQRDAIADIASLSQPTTYSNAQYIHTTVSSAELIKVTANAFLALKISFANSIAKLADAANADITAVMDGAGSDRRIGRAFLQAGRGYGGGCFPKDVSGLIRSAEDHGVDMEIMHAATAVNESMPHYIIQKAQKCLGPDNSVWRGKKAAVLGMSFKAGTSDTRRSPAITIANTLADLGAIVYAFDPEAMDEAKPLLGQSIQPAKNTNEAVADATAIFVATDWQDFISLNWTIVAENAPNAVVVDCMNRLDNTAVRTAGLQYVGVGRS